MTQDRLEFLMEQWADDSLNERETAELVELLGSPENRRSVARQMAMHQTLVEHFASAVRLRIVPVRPRPRRVAVAGGLLALAASVLLLLFVGSWWRSNGNAPVASVSSVPLTTRPAEAAGARLVELNGTIDVVNADGVSSTAVLGQVIPPGRQLRTGTNDSSAVVEYADRTRLEISGDSTIDFPREQSAGKRIRVASGSLQVEVPPQPLNLPMIVSSQQAEIRVMGTRFLCSADADVTRIDLASGELELVLTGQSHSVTMAAGSSALLRSGREPVIRSLPEQIRTPARNLGSSNLTAIAYRPDGGLVAANSRVLARWDAAFLKQSQPLLDGHTAGDGAVFSADGSTLAFAAKDGSLRIVDLEAPGRWISVGGGKQQLRGVVPAPNGSWVAAVDPARPGAVRRWDCRTGSELPALESDAKELSTLAIAPDGKTLAAGAVYRQKGSQQILLWETESGRSIPSLAGTSQIVRVLAFSEDGRQLASTGSDGVVALWDLPSGKLRRSIEGARPRLHCMSFSPDGRFLAGGTTNGHVWVWDCVTGEARAWLEVGHKWVFGVRFSPDGASLVTTGFYLPVLVWDLRPMLESNGQGSRGRSPGGATKPGAI